LITAALTRYRLAIIIPHQSETDSTATAWGTLSIAQAAGRSELSTRIIGSLLGTGI